MRYPSSSQCKQNAPAYFCRQITKSRWLWAASIWLKFCLNQENLYPSLPRWFGFHLPSAQGGCTGPVYKAYLFSLGTVFNQGYRCPLNSYSSFAQGQAFVKHLIDCSDELALRLAATSEPQMLHLFNLSHASYLKMEAHRLRVDRLEAGTNNSSAPTCDTNHNEL